MTRIFIFTSFILLYNGKEVLGICYFPPELQGQFEMQSSLAEGQQVQYSPVHITIDAIPIWGQCHKKIGNNFILRDEWKTRPSNFTFVTDGSHTFSWASCLSFALHKLGDVEDWQLPVFIGGCRVKCFCTKQIEALKKRSGGGDCIRCFHLNLRSRNILQVLTEGLDKCYTSEEAAKNACPNLYEINVKPYIKFEEILLYKIRDMDGEPTSREYCPINGKFSFIYNINDGSDNKVECPNYTSIADNCPSGSAFNLHFKSCSFEDHDISFECLGHWNGPNNQKYLTLLDTRIGGDDRPRYRCALYQEDSETDIINIAFSSDSTCATDLESATEGYEVVTLKKLPTTEWPLEVKASSCRFPNWSQGVWEHLRIEGNGLTYRDHSSFKTYRLRCIGSDTGVRERIPVFVKSHCGQEKEYNCLWLKKRSDNVLEFQLSQKASAYYDETLCDDDNFDGHMWITQGRLDRIVQSPCPVSGLYTGNIPDERTLCAKLSSNCDSTEVMYYSVMDCEIHQVFDEREYRCLGQWKENNLVYTYTQRTDASAHECFVGSILSNYEIYIIEAGEHCDRKMDPLSFGMKLVRKGPCTSINATKTVQPVRPATPPATRRPARPSSARPPWKTLTEPPLIDMGSNDISGSASVLASEFLLMLTAIFQLYLNRFSHVTD